MLVLLCVVLIYPTTHHCLTPEAACLAGKESREVQSEAKRVQKKGSGMMDGAAETASDASQDLQDKVCCCPFPPPPHPCS